MSDPPILKKKSHAVHLGFNGYAFSREKKRPLIVARPFFLWLPLLRQNNQKSNAASPKSRFKAKYFGLEELHISLGGMQERREQIRSRYGRSIHYRTCQVNKQYTDPEKFMAGTPKIGGLFCRCVSFSIGGAFSGSMLVFPDVCNLGDDQKISFWGIIASPEFFFDRPCLGSKLLAC